MPNTYGVSLGLILKGSISDLNATSFGTLAVAPLFPWTQRSIVTGAGASKVNLIYTATRTLTSGSDDVLCLTDSTLKDAFGVALVYARVNTLAIYNTAAVGNLEVGGATNPWEGWTTVTGSKVTVIPGGLLLLSNVVGYVGVSGTTKNIKIHNAGAGSVTYNIAIFGSDA